MSQQTNEPLKGEAAFRAEKQRIEKANEAAYARGRQERAADAAEAGDAAGVRGRGRAPEGGPLALGGSSYVGR